MRVLIDYRPALRHRTGVGEYVHELALALAAQMAAEDELTIFSSSWRDRLRRPDHTRLRPSDHRVPVRLLNFLWHRLEWPPVESLTRQTYDVVHSLTPLLLPTRGAARIVTIHDLDFLSHPDRGRAEIRRDYAALIRDHAARADHIVVNSHYTATAVERELGIHPSRLSEVTPGRPPWTRRHHRPQHGYILFVGTLEPRKNVGALLDAYERLLSSSDDVPDLVLAGPVREGSFEWLHRISGSPFGGRARHLGYVDAGAREALYAGASLLVMPSLEEGFGLPALEAMTVGVPVVAASRGALPEVLGDAAVFVNPEDPDDIAAGITRILHDEPLAEQLTDRGLARASAFDWRRSAQKILLAYQSAIAHSRESRRPGVRR